MNVQRHASLLFAALVFAAPGLAQERVPVKFAAGASQTVIGGTLKGMQSRTYVLNARAGQQLTADLSSDNTGVRFGNRGTSLNYDTSKGPNYVYILNDGRATTSYRLTISIR